MGHINNVDIMGFNIGYYSMIIICNLHQSVSRLRPAGSDQRFPVFDFFLYNFDGGASKIFPPSIYTYFKNTIKPDG